VKKHKVDYPFFKGQHFLDVEDGLYLIIVGPWGEPWPNHVNVQGPEGIEYCYLPWLKPFEDIK
jgi:hypothetical protein